MKFDRLNIELGKTRTPAPQRKESGDPFRVLIMGDFSGRESRGIIEPLAGRQPLAVDCDNLDKGLAKLKVALRLPTPVGGNGDMEIRFTSLEDFHPDKLLTRLALFANLRTLRLRLLDPAGFETAAREMQQWMPQEATASPAQAPTPPAAAAPETEDGMFERLLGQPKSAKAAGGSTAGKTNIDALIKDLIKPHVVQADHPQQQTLLRVLDTVISERMRSVLHHPEFKALESAWRGLDFLVRNLELNEELKLFFLDVSRSELQADLQAREDLSRTGLHTLLVEQTVGSPGAELWDAITGLYVFSPVREDAEFLGWLAAVSRKAGAPFLAAADIVTFRTLPQPGSEDQVAWEILRGLPVAASAGLAAPRFLLRLPYGKGADPVEQFEFEEAATPPLPDTLLWGCPALACTCLLGQSFTASGWDFSPDDTLELGGIPTHVYKEDGESKMTPCAELWMSESESIKLMNAGLMPFLSVRGRDVIRLARFQSISNPPKALAGRWNE